MTSPRARRSRSRLAQLCDKARADTEALGLPADKGFVVMKPTAAIGVRFAEDIGKLEARLPPRRSRSQHSRRTSRLLLQRARSRGEAVRAQRFGAVCDHSLPREALARERRGARDRHGRARVRRTALSRALTRRPEVVSPFSRVGAQWCRRSPNAPQLREKSIIGCLSVESDSGWLVGSRLTHE